MHFLEQEIHLSPYRVFALQHTRELVKMTFDADNLFGDVHPFCQKGDLLLKTRRVQFHLLEETPEPLTEPLLIGLQAEREFLLNAFELLPNPFQPLLEIPSE